MFQLIDLGQDHALVIVLNKGDRLGLFFFFSGCGGDICLHGGVLRVNAGHSCCRKQCEQTVFHHFCHLFSPEKIGFKFVVRLKNGELIRLN